jgi:hypothetical protein
MKKLLLLLPLLSSIILSAQQNKKSGPDAVGNVITAYDYKSNQVYNGYTKQSFYLTMRDSVKLAVDVYLPKGLKPGDKIPVLLNQTRYWRGVEFRAFFKPFFGNKLPGKPGKLLKDLIASGYAAVIVDTRGTGASYGRCNYPWSMDEIKDGAEVVNWAIKQSWCSGTVGSLGISYSGTTSEMLLVNRHPAVKAIVPMFALYDAYDDIAFPNGLQFRYFTSNWGIANAMLDKNKLPTKKFLAKLLIKGVDPVDGKGRRKLLKGAMQAHKDNISVHDGVLTIRNRDDVPLEGKYMSGIDVFSPHAYRNVIDSSNAAIYCYSGWFDGDYQHAAVKRFLNLTNPNSKLILGPWEHGGYLNLSPSVNQTGSFDKASELLKYFDFHLKGMQTGIDKEPRVYYYTMIEDKWKSSSVWPPVSSPTIFYLGNNTLNTSMPVSGDFVSYVSDTTAGSGNMTRWKTVNGQVKEPPMYEEFGTLTPKMACFTGDVLAENMEVSGHPLVDLWVDVPSDNAGFFVYLCDVDENGHVQYVTEGSLNGKYRKVGVNPPYADVAPYHSFKGADVAPFIAGESALLQFDMLPTSYLFKKGHKVMIAISCADTDHFEPVTPHGIPVKILTANGKNTSVTLPVVTRN